MILWDSRTLHGGKVGDGQVDQEVKDRVDFARLVLTVCMTPKSKATRRVLHQREEAFKRGITLTHWPHEFVPQGFGNSGGDNINYKFVPPELTDAQKDLLS
eukprot:c6746_g1_i2.p3 GENE.c6746_g1_i2~~c6746_g1_i2.p3  ORF type:complete len:101 (-),score=22.59 c6746_g1_i2:166-468(-)